MTDSTIKELSSNLLWIANNVPELSVKGIKTLEKAAEVLSCEVENQYRCSEDEEWSHCVAAYLDDALEDGYEVRRILILPTTESARVGVCQRCIGTGVVWRGDCEACAGKGKTPAPHAARAAPESPATAGGEVVTLFNVPCDGAEDPLGWNLWRGAPDRRNELEGKGWEFREYVPATLLAEMRERVSAPTEAMLYAMARACGGCTFGYYDRESNTYQTDRGMALQIYKAMLDALDGES